MHDWHSEVRARLAHLRLKPEREADIVDEIAQHLAERYREATQGGATSDEATRLALAEFKAGNALAQRIAALKQAHAPAAVRLGASTGHVLEDLRQDLRYAARSFTKQPGFAVTAVLMLALGLGATTAIFSVVNGIFLRPLPYPNAERLMQPLTIFASGSLGSFSYPDFEDLRDQNRSFAGLAAYVIRDASATMGEQGFRVGRAGVSPGFLSLIGVPPALGRGFTADEEQAGAPVALVSYGYWQNRLAGRSDFASQSVRMNERDYAIIGVMPAGYDFPAGTDLWAPFQQPMAGQNRTARGYGIVGRLRDDVSVAAAQQDLSAIARRLKQLHGDGANMVDATARPLMEQLAGNVRPALTVLLVASGALLLVACVNVANLMLARALSRDRESALRLALGAGAGRVARSFMAEALVLTVAGAGLGLVLAFGGVAALLAQDTTRLPRMGEIGVDLRVLVFSLAVALLAAFIVSVFPALRAARRDPRDALADSQRIQGGSAAIRRLSAGLVMAQIALTVVLLVGAGLVGRSVLKLLDEDPGYRTDSALVMDVWLPAEDYAGLRTELTAGDAYNAGYLERLMSALRMIPGVERVGGINHFPLTDPLTPSPGSNGNYLLLDRPNEAVSPEDRARLFAESRFGNAQFRVASADYFGAMGIPLIRGRVFDSRDTHDAPHVAVISASFAEAAWPGQDPLGKLIDFTGMDGDLRAFTIVGIVGDIEELGIGATPQPLFYADVRQRPRRASQFHVVIEGGGNVAALTAAAREVARNVDPQVPVSFRTLQEVVSAWLAQRQLVLVLLTLFGVLALVLAATGVYGVLTYRAVRRTREIGVRVALGARSADVVRLLVREGALFALGGVAIGLIVAGVSTRLVASWLYDVGRLDPTTFAAVAVAMLAVAVAASWIPSYRASRTDAMEALRHD